MTTSTPDIEAAKLLEKVAPLPVPPFILDPGVYDSMGAAPPLHGPTARPLPSWTFARKSRGGEILPQTIAHRGYKANFPENTMAAFQGAVKVGSDAIETDIHLTKDGVVVLSHDATLKRCFGRDEKIIKCVWDDIRELETLKAPHEHMPRLSELLEFLAQDGQENIWLLLDIKIDNPASDVIRLIAENISSVAPHRDIGWNQRILLGCWTAEYLPPCAEFLPTFPITLIGFSTSYARQFFDVPHVSFNIIQHALLIPYFGARFLLDARRKGRPVYTWTVNDDEKMRWCIREGLDGVITDNPKRFKEICRDWRQGHQAVHISTRQLLLTAWIQLMIMIFGIIFWAKHGGLDRSQMKEPEWSSPVSPTTTEKPRRKKMRTPR